MPLFFKPVLPGQLVTMAMVGLALAAVGWSAPKQANLTLRRIPPSPAIQAAAVAAKMNLGELAAPLPRGALVPGDQVTALLTLTDGKKAKQWVIELTADELTEAERNRPHQSVTLFTTTGHEFKYGGGRAALKIRILGPLDAVDAGRKNGEASAMQQRRITVSADYLALGLDQVAAANARLAALQKENPKLKPVGYTVSSMPYSAEKLAKEKAKVKAGMIESTEAEERATGGAVLALQEFFTTAQRTPGLQEVLMSVLDVPWWAILRRGGKLEIDFNNMPLVLPLSAEDWGLREEEKVNGVVYILGLNSKPTLLVLMAVTAPRPPLMAGAGIVGFAACAPNGKGPVLTMEIVSSRTAEAGP